jgi:hypothetical protein
MKKVIISLLGIITILVAFIGYREHTEYKRILYYDCYYNETVGPITELWLEQRENECKEQVNEQLEFFKYDFIKED